jgi:anti-anti-sigma factor
VDLDRTLPHAAPAASLLPVDIYFTADRRRARLDVTGELDGSTAADLLDAVRQVLAAPATERVELHLAALTFIDSAGIRCLLTCRTAAEDRGSRLALVDPGPRVIGVLRITGLLHLFGLAEHAGSDPEQRSQAGTGRPRGPHGPQSPAELFERSATLRMTAQEICAGAVAARRVGALRRGWPETPAR